MWFWKKETVLFVASVCIAGVTSNPICQTPTNLSQILSDGHSPGDSSFMILPAIQRQIQESLDDVSEDFVSTYTLHLYGNTTCPSSPSTDVESGIEDRSTCPFYYIINHDPFRYPPSLAEARCKCAKCLDTISGISENVCEAAYYTIKVLRRTEDCEDGYYMYAQQWYRIPVGCTCAKRPVAYA